jgi:fermentation-respiration switch protein FrsA (DUF1100 family)
MVQKYSDVCEHWPRAQLPDDYWAPINSDLPVLALSGAVDPVTPPYWGEQVKVGLTNLSHIVVPGGHHIVTSEGCIAQLITMFITTGNAKGLDASCAKNIQPLAIYIPPSFMDKTNSPEMNKAKE